MIASQFRSIILYLNEQLLRLVRHIQGNFVPRSKTNRDKREFELIEFEINSGKQQRK